MSSTENNTIDRASRAMQKAEDLFAQGRLSEAIRSLKSAIRFGADPAACYLQLASLYHIQQKIHEALDAASKAVDFAPDNVTAWEALVGLYMENRDYVHAIDAGRELLKRAPHHIPTRDMLHSAYVNLGNMEAAMRVVNEQIRIDPSNPNHHYSRAMLYMHTDEIGMAIEEFERTAQMTNDEELLDAVYQQIEALDMFQIEKIVILAVEDDIFRAKLSRNLSEAIQEKGFTLSEDGIDHLTALCSQGLTDVRMDGYPRSYLYH
jgi:tetratricopeptide (TPR) repeat protein